jgi:hypothetical protein
MKSVIIFTPYAKINNPSGPRIENRQLIKAEKIIHQ